MTSTQKVVLVTGCGEGGIGFALCEEFAAQGCIVYATDIRLENMESFRHPNIRKRVMDITNQNDIEHTVQGVLTETGKIDILYNNAGAASIGPIAEASIEQLRSTFELNTFGAIRVSQAVLPSMFERKEGLIVNTGSIVALITPPWNGVYSATKSALHSLTEALASECKPFGIKVMLVAPGGVQSNIAKNNEATFSLPSESRFKRWEKKMIERLNVGQGPGSMNNKTFAKGVVVQALKANPPPFMSLGLGSTRFYLLQWLPRQFVLDQLASTVM